MQDCFKFATPILCAAVFLFAGRAEAQGAAQTVRPLQPVKSGTTSGSRAQNRTLSKDDRSSVVAVALHSKRVRPAGRDCSHLVHAIYEHAGFPYTYADSEDLYAGVEGFRRVSKPEPADLVVWHGHVGIVILPSGHQFFSFLSTGPGIDDYRSRYWRGRGQPRFYRYVKHGS